MSPPNTEVPRLRREPLPSIDPETKNATSRPSPPETPEPVRILTCSFAPSTKIA